MFARIRYLLALSKGTKTAKILGRRYYGSEDQLAWLGDIEREVVSLATDGITRTSRDGKKHSYRCYLSEEVLLQSKSRA